MVGELGRFDYGKSIQEGAGFVGDLCGDLSLSANIGDRRAQR